MVAKKENDIRASQTNHVANLGLNDILEIEKAMENEIRERVQELRNKILAGYCIDVFRKEMYLSRHSELPRVVSDDDLGGRINLLLILWRWQNYDTAPISSTKNGDLYIQAFSLRLAAWVID